jgi:hypothetical protein
MTTLAVGTTKYHLTLHGHNFVCAESTNGERYWWDLLQLDDSAEPAFVKQFPHTNLPQSVAKAANAFISNIKGKRRHARLVRGVNHAFLYA